MANHPAFSSPLVQDALHFGEIDSLTAGETPCLYLRPSFDVKLHLSGCSVWGTLSRKIACKSGGGVSKRFTVNEPRFLLYLSSGTNVSPLLASVTYAKIRSLTPSVTTSFEPNTISILPFVYLYTMFVSHPCVP